MALFSTACLAVDISTELVFLLKKGSFSMWLAAYYFSLTYFSGKKTIIVVTGLLES